LTALTDRFDVDIRHAHGCDIDRSTPPIGTPHITSLAADFFNGFDQSGDVVASKEYEKADFKFFGSPTAGLTVRNIRSRQPLNWPWTSPDRTS